MITRYVNPNAAGGGNGTTNALSGANCAFTSLSAAEAALPNPLGDSWEIICESGGNADTTRVSFTGSYTPSATNFVRIKAGAGHEATNTWDTSRYRIAPTSGTGSTISISENYIFLEGLQIEALSGDAVNLDFTTNNFVNRCRIRNSSGTGMGIYARAGVSILTNNVIYGFNGNVSAAGINARNASATCYSYNNTIYDCTTGMGTSNSGVYVARNTVAFGCTTDFATGTRHNCVSEDASAGTSNNCKNNQTLTSGVFTDIANRDFSLLSTDTVLLDAGQDLSGDPDALADWTGFSDDFLGESRSGTWDVGALEYISVGGGGVTGTGASDLQTLTGAASGTSVVTAAGAGTLGQATASAAGNSVVTGTAAPSLEAMTAAASGTSEIAGTGAVSLQVITASAQASPVVAGSGAGSLQSLTASASSSTSTIGTGAASLESLTAAANASPVVTGTAAGTLESLTASATDGLGPIEGTAAASLQSLTASASGSSTVTATGAAALQIVTAAGTGHPVVNGTGSGTLQQLTASASSGAITGTAAATLQALTAVASYGSQPGRATVSATLTGSAAASHQRVSSAAISAATTGNITIQ